MGRNIVLVLNALVLASLFSIESGAWCITPWGCAAEAIEKLEAGETPTPTLAALCVKGVASKGIFSLRSFQGYACKYSKTWAALAMSVCPTVDEKLGKTNDKFIDSKCFNFAKEKLGTDDLAEAKEILIDELKKKSDQVKDILCTLIGYQVPGASLICDKIKIVKKEQP